MVITVDVNGYRKSFHSDDGNTAIEWAIEWLSSRVGIYRFVGEYTNCETGEITEKIVEVDDRYCDSMGEAFMIASEELFKKSSEYEIMSSVRRL